MQPMVLLGSGKKEQVNSLKYKSSFLPCQYAASSDNNNKYFTQLFVRSIFLIIHHVQSTSHFSYLLLTAFHFQTPYLGWDFLIMVTHVLVIYCTLLYMELLLKTIWMERLAQTMIISAVIYLCNVSAMLGALVTIELANAIEGVSCNHIGLDYWRYCFSPIVFAHAVRSNRVDMVWVSSSK